MENLSKHRLVCPSLADGAHALILKIDDMLIIY